MPAAHVSNWYLTPFDLDEHSWHGRHESLDGAPAGPISEDDVAGGIALYYGDEGNVWDGQVACIFMLNDGRYVAFETFYGPTGNGFSEDAYGGDANIAFANSLETVALMGLTEHGRKLCGWEN